MANSSDIRQKEVINIVNGRRLGTIVDMNFSPDGRISSIAVPGPFSVFNFLRSNRAEIVIPWESIVKIGEDVILVRVNEMGGAAQSDDWSGSK
jgi:YlmC/YmxH family sporulation protein